MEGPALFALLRLREGRHLEDRAGLDGIVEPHASQDGGDQGRRAEHIQHRFLRVLLSVLPSAIEPNSIPSRRRLRFPSNSFVYSFHAETDEQIMNTAED